MLCPSLLPYELGTRAQFSAAGFNGRYLTDDAYDAMLIARDEHHCEGWCGSQSRAHAT